MDAAFALSVALSEQYWVYTLYTFDDLGRAWKTDSVTTKDGSSDVWTEQTSFYDLLGREVFSSEPYQMGTITSAIYTVPGQGGSTLTSGVTGGFEIHVPRYNGQDFGTWTTAYDDAAPGAPFAGELDPFYRVRAVIRPDGGRTLTSYSGFASTVTVEGITTGWNSSGAPVLSSSSTEYLKDLLGRVRTVTPQLGTGAAYSYNGLGQLTVVSLGSQQRSFVYDALGRLREATQPETGRVRDFTYDSIGNVLGYTDAKNQSFASTYDFKGRLLKTLQGGVTFVENTYDCPKDSSGNCTSQPTNAKGKLIESVGANFYLTAANEIRNDRKVRKQFTYYPADGRLYQEKTILDLDALNLSYRTFVLSHSYDAATGLPTQEIRPYGGARTWTYRHGAPVSGALGTNAIGLSGLTYNAAGALSQIQLAYSGTQVGALDFPRDAFSRPADALLKNASGGTLWSAGPYAYDPAGNVQKVGPGQKFTYDLANRLVGATVERHLNMTDPSNVMSHTFAYGYDGYGNLTSRTQSTPPDYNGPLAHYLTSRDETQGLETLPYIEAVNVAITMGTTGGAVNNRIATVRRGESGGGAAITYRYDQNGNLEWDGKQRYLYDPMNRVIATRSADSASAPLKDQMAYDSAGERFMRILYDAAASGNPATSYTFFIRSGAEVVSEQTVSATSSQALERRGYLYEGGRLVARSKQKFLGMGSSRFCPAEISRNRLIQFASAMGHTASQVSLPELSEPEWTLSNGGSHADLAYQVTGLGDDVAWIEIRKSRIKTEGNSPCTGEPSCEDEIETQRVTRPESGWPGAVPFTFARLQGGKTYKVILSFSSGAAGDLILGPRTLYSQEETLVCPRDPGSLAPRNRRAWLDSGVEGEGEIPLWRIHADSPSGYTVKAMKANGSVEIG